MRFLDSATVTHLIDLKAKATELKNKVGPADGPDEPAASDRLAIVEQLASCNTLLQGHLTDLQKRIVAMVSIVTPALKSKIPDWKGYTCTKPDPAQIIENMCNVSNLNQLSTAYGVASALKVGVEQALSHLQLNLNVTHKTEMKELGTALDSGKLTMGVVHACNVIYVRAPQAANGKNPSTAKAGLVRELQRKLNKTGIVLPAELAKAVRNLQ